MKTECLINNKRYKYDACSSNDLEIAINFYYPDYIYFGSNNIIYIDNKLNKFKDVYHFFIRNTKENRIKIRKMKLKNLYEKR